MDQSFVSAAYQGHFKSSSISSSHYTSPKSASTGPLGTTETRSDVGDEVLRINHKDEMISTGQQSGSHDRRSRKSVDTLVDMEAEVPLSRTPAKGPPREAEAEKDSPEIATRQRNTTVRSGKARPLTIIERHASLLSLIAQKEYQVRETKSKLAREESELAELKKRWEKVAARAAFNSTTTPSPSRSSRKSTTGQPSASTNPHQLSDAINLQIPESSSSSASSSRAPSPVSSSINLPPIPASTTPSSFSSSSPDPSSSASHASHAPPRSVPSMFGQFIGQLQSVVEDAVPALTSSPVFTNSYHHLSQSPLASASRASLDDGKSRDDTGRARLSGSLSPGARRISSEENTPPVETPKRSYRPLSLLVNRAAANGSDCSPRLIASASLTSQPNLNQGAGGAVRRESGSSGLQFPETPKSSQYHSRVQRQRSSTLPKQESDLDLSKPLDDAGGGAGAGGSSWMYKLEDVLNNPTLKAHSNRASSYISSNLSGTLNQFLSSTLTPPRPLLSNASSSASSPSSASSTSAPSMLMPVTPSSLDAAAESPTSLRTLTDEGNSTSLFGKEFKRANPPLPYNAPRLVRQNSTNSTASSSSEN